MNLLKSIGFASRWVFDTAALAFGVVPGGTAAVLNSECTCTDDQPSDAEVRLNPATLLPMADGLFDVQGNMHGFDDLDWTLKASGSASPGLRACDGH